VGRRLPILLAAVTAACAASASAGQPRAVAPRPFALVTASGRQPASDLRAVLSPSTSQPTIGLVTVTTTLESIGERTPRLSVVRPGERIRFALPAGSHGRFTLVLQKLCGGLPPTPVLTSRASASWTIRLRPGRYTASLLFSWRTTAGRVDESGTVGLLVSRSAFPGLVRAPSCR
jgi:hypothetical protein